MDIKEFFRKKAVLGIITLLAIVIIILPAGCIQSGSENPEKVTATPPAEGPGKVSVTSIRYPADSPNENASYDIWTKVVKSSSGISPSKSDSYNAMSVSLYPHGPWFKTAIETGWRMPIQIAGFGAIRPGDGPSSANDLKTITLKIDESLDVHTYSTMNLHGEENYIAGMLSAATDSLHDKTWPQYSPEDVLNSSSKPVMHNSDRQTDNIKNRFSDILDKWQYSDPYSGDSTDAVYAIDTYSICRPGTSEEIRFISAFSWGLSDNSQNEIGLRIHLPPDPETLTQEQLKQYNISIQTSSFNGQINHFYVLDRLTCEIL
jgi:hypothetical protein